MKHRQKLEREFVYRRVAELVHEIVGTPLEEITDDATIDGTLQMNSVTFVELQVTIEDEFEAELDPIMVVELNRFGDIVNYIHEVVTESRA